MNNTILTDLSADVTADELFDRIVAIAGDADPAHAARLLRDTLVLTCAHALADTGEAHGTLYAQLTESCRRYRVDPRDAADLQRLRRDGNTGKHVLPVDVLYGCRAVAQLVSAVFSTAVPTRVVACVPMDAPRAEPLRTVDLAYARCTVRGTRGEHLVAEVDMDGAPAETVIALDSDYFDHRYLLRMVRPGTQLNLLDCSRDEDGTLRPGIIVYEPDCLLDISSIAACFESFGRSPLMYTVGRMTPRANSRAILLGGLAGAALDDIISNPEADVTATFRRHFADHAAEYASCEDLETDGYLADARAQAGHIRRALEVMAGYGDDGGERFSDRAVLEPSFVCERLGIQGRIDLMTLDMHLLVEQKSGKNYRIASHSPGPYGYQDEKHYVQVLLYYGMLRYNFGLRPDSMRIRLLYSKYPPEDGLVAVGPLKRLLLEALRLRNTAVAVDYAMARGGIAPYLPFLTPERLSEARRRDSFFARWVRPRLEAVTAPLHTMDALTRAYFCRMTAFVMREQLLARVGTQEGVGSGAADLWAVPFETKREAGNIYAALTIAALGPSGEDSAVDTVVLDVPVQGDDFLPNFRTGDMVYLYAYRSDRTPDARQALLLKGVMAAIAPGQVTVHLLNAQRNRRLFAPGHGTAVRRLWAIEHASSDMAAATALQSLHQLVTVADDRRRLLLGLRDPRRDASLTLTQRYSPAYDDIVLASRQARDYYLLVGPPGTGKTSMALRFIVTEELASSSGASVLLMSYTNRAVDEICAMLLGAGISFIRIGSEYSCDEASRPFLISHVAAAAGDDIRAAQQALEQVRVVVGTTSSLLARPFLFALRRFSLAVVDEAGQLTEPAIVGLLARHGETDAQPVIGRFILVGDYKQLPAVVQQSPAESAVTEPALQAIGLTDCRDSLFERLIRHERAAGRTDFIGILRRQGRMHPDVAAFPNAYFYFRERLEPVPCPHQTETALAYRGTPADALDRLLMAQRMVFVSVEKDPASSSSDKANEAEAGLVADVLARIRQYKGEDFDARRSVGVIVPYRNQIAMIRRAISRRGLEGLEDVSIDTVERYQGSQRDVIVYSFTVSHRWQLAFLTASSLVEEGRVIDRKLNVAITRARCQMIMTGDARVLSQNSTFAALIGHVKAHGGYMEQKKCYICDKKDSSL